MGLSNRLILDLNRRIAASIPYRGRVLDLGCGTAPYRELILQTADEYIGVDWDNGPHDRGNVDVVADLTKPLPFDDGFADIVVAFQVMEHLPEPRRFLEECRRIVRPGGLIVLVTPFMWQVHEAPHDYFRYTRFGLEHLLDQAGFESIHVEETTGFWQTWILKFNYHTARPTGSRLRYLWAPVWVVGQWLAPRLDRRGRHPEETASYVARALRPS